MFKSSFKVLKKILKAFKFEGLQRPYGQTDNKCKLINGANGTFHLAE